MPNRIVNKLIKTYFILNANLRRDTFNDQEHILFGLLDKCQETVFGRKYGFKHIQNVKDFQNAVPLAQYKDLEPRIHYMLKGEKNITYPGKIDWFATSSGTTGGSSKFIPVTKEGLKKSHFKGGTEILNFFCKNNPRSQFLKGKGLVVGGGFSTNPYTGQENVGFISAILQKNTPRFIKLLKEPKDDIAYIDNREEKVHAIIQRVTKQNITFINGQPGWLLNLLYKALEYTHKENILDIWPNLELFFWGGLPIDLYKAQYTKMIPSVKMKYYQVYNASEGFFAVQDKNFVDDMLLLINHGTFYEFIPLSEYGKENPQVLTLKEVQVGQEYVLVITTCSGLRRYIIGDIVKFTSTKPRKIQITGRTKYFIDMLGERLFLDHIEKAMLQASKITDTIITDYTVGPLVFEGGGETRGCHERVIEFVTPPTDIQQFGKILDDELGKINNYYFDERHDTKVIGAPQIHVVKQGTFYSWLKSKGKLGGQHKVPKVSNDRSILDEILPLISKDLNA